MLTKIIQMKKLYYRSLIIFSIFTIIFSSEVTVLFAVFLTFGIAVPLIFSITPLIYLLGLFPVFYFGDQLEKRNLKIMLSILILASIATIPNLVSKLDIMKIEKLLALDFSPHEIATPPRTLEIRRPSIFDRKLVGIISGNAICDSICTSIIINNEVEWVRVAVKHSTFVDKKKNVTTSVLFQIGNSIEECTAPDNSAPVVVPCIVEKIDHGIPAELVVTFEQSKKKRAAANNSVKNFHPWRWRRISAHALFGDKQRLLYFQEEQEALLISFPTVIVPASTCGNNYLLGDFPYRFRRYRFRINPIDYKRVFAELGYKLPDISNIPMPPKFFRWRWC